MLRPDEGRVVSHEWGGYSVRIKLFMFCIPANERICLEFEFEFSPFIVCMCFFFVLIQRKGFLENTVPECAFVRLCSAHSITQRPSRRRYHPLARRHEILPTIIRQITFFRNDCNRYMVGRLESKTRLN